MLCCQPLLHVPLPDANPQLFFLCLPQIHIEYNQIRSSKNDYPPKLGTTLFFVSLTTLQHDPMQP